LCSYEEKREKIYENKKKKKIEKRNQLKVCFGT